MNFDEIRSIVNKLGNQFNNNEKYVFYSLFRNSKIIKVSIYNRFYNAQRLCKLKDLKKGYNPFFKENFKKRISNKDIILFVNKKGKSYPKEEQYKFISFGENSSNGSKTVLIENLITKEQRITRYSRLNNSNPFKKGFKRLNLKEIEYTVNKLGKNNEDQDVFIFDSISNRFRPLSILIKHKKTGVTHICQYTHLKHGANPFKTKPTLREQKEITTIFCKISLNSPKKCKIFKEKHISKKCRVDILITTETKNIVLEIKHSKSKWTKKHLKNQKNRYLKKLNQLFPSSQNEVYICSKNGKYGINYKEMFRIIQSI